MDRAQEIDLLVMLKALADEQRMAMFGRMITGESTVGQMAEHVGLAESTVSHHTGKLHAAGLLRLRMAGAQRFYSLNAPRIEKFKAYVQEIDQPRSPVVEEVSDNRWIDALDFDEADKQVLRTCTFNGRLTHFPAKEKKMLVILRWLATRFEPGRRYTEKEVNALMTEVHPDYATLRRSLVSYGFVRRERGGGDYWLTPDNEAVAP